MKYCKKCGAEISEGASFCGNCGDSVSNVSKSGMGKKKGIIIGCIGMIVLAVIVVVVLFASVQKKGLDEYFEKFVNLTKDEIISKYEDKIINKDNYLESDISDYMKKSIMENAGDEDICIDYRLPGFEGDMFLVPEEGDFDWMWLNILPTGKNLYDYKDSYDALIHDFTKKYGEPDVYNSDGNDVHSNEFNFINQGYIVGTYTVGYGWDKSDNIYLIMVGFKKSDQKTNVESNDTDTTENDSLDILDDNSEDEEDDEDW